jgi:hypothetical protein
MPLYAGCDLHSNNNHLALVDQKGKRVDHWKLANDPKVILETLRSQRLKIVGGCSGVDVQLVLVGGYVDGGWVSGAFGEPCGDSAI